MPRCPIHPQVTLICPACIGAKGGRTVTKKKLQAIRRAAKARRRGQARRRGKARRRRTKP
jgi:hypothetical protein